MSAPPTPLRPTAPPAGAAPPAARRPRLAVLAQLWPYLRRDWPLMLVAAVALLIAAGILLFLGHGLRLIVDRGLAQGGDARYLDQALLVMLALIAVLGAATYVRFLCVTLIGERVVAALRCDVFAHVLQLSPRFFETTRTGELISRITADTTVLQGAVGSSVSFAVRHLITLLGGIVLMVATSPKLAALVLLIVPLVIGPILLFGRRVRRLARQAQDRLADVGAVMDEALHGIQTVQAFTREAHMAGRFTDHVQATYRAARARIQARALMTASVILLAFGAIAVILWIGGHDKIDGRMSGGDLSAFIFYAVVVAGAVAAIGEVLGELQRAAGATERLLELLAMPPAFPVVPAQPRAPGDPSQALPRPPGLVLEAVSFRYPSRPEHAALSDIHARIEGGETVAVVGPSGAGKTTLFQLLLRFQAPDAGRILLGGRDIAAWPVPVLRGAIGLVAQEPTIFSVSIRDNIAFGRPGASEAEITAAAEAAQCSEFIAGLPQGLDTVVGERGLTLSGGQRQRLAIARAVLRDPALLLLDEATSALDAESEALVQQGLARLMAGRTTLVIAHRLATVQAADRILVLERGRLVAQGRHGELVAQNGLYARLAALQFRDAA